MKRVLRIFTTTILCVVMLAGGMLFGSDIYSVLFGSVDAKWVSERFSEELSQKSELIVLEKTITGQETVTVDAWLIGTVQTVVVPYTFTVNFSVDLEQAQVAYDEESNTIYVSLPMPSVAYYKLTVDEDNVEKSDLLYPLTTERYAEIKSELEEKLYDEAVNDQTLIDTAWETTVTEMENLYLALLDANEKEVQCDVEVIALEETAEEATEE